MSLRALAAALPIAAFLIFFLVARSRGRGLRESVIDAAVVWGISTAFITEGLSLFHSLTPLHMGLSWALMAGLGGLYCLRNVRLQGGRNPVADTFRVLRPESPRSSLAVAAGAAAGLVLAVTGLTAVLAPPNTWDAIEYHLPRVIEWLQHRSVAFYPTYSLKQLFMPPWSEYAILHLHGLSGGDRFDNLVQWFSSFGSVVGVSLIARLLGAGAAGQAFAALIAATIPEGILQASGAKNDYAAAFWLVALTYYLLSYAYSSSRAELLGACASLGLGLLTKGTVYIFAAPLAAVAAIAWPPEARKRAIRYLPLAALLVIALNLPHYARNFAFFGAPLGPAALVPPRGYKVTNDRYGAGVTFSNIVRNVALHCGTPSDAANAWLTAAAGALVKLAGEDPNDPASTWDDTRFAVPAPSRHEALAGNPLHVALIVLTLGILAGRRRTRDRLPLVLAAALTAAFLLFCAAFKWQPWHTRLQLPLFVLWCGVIATVLAARIPRPAAITAALILLVSAAPALFDNQLRPLLYPGELNLFNQDRDALRFMDNRGLYPSYQSAAAFALAHADCKQIGLDLSVEPVYHYSLHALLGSGGGREIRTLAVSNDTKKFADADSAGFRPCLVVCPGCAGETGGSGDARRGRQVFGNVLVTSVASGGCSVAFSGWYPAEKAGSDWHRWSAGAGQIEVVAEQDAQGQLTGGVASLKQPNRIEVSVNGQYAMTFSVASPGFQPFPSLPLTLKAGRNVIAFSSANSPGTAPGDNRLLAMAIRNARVTAGDVTCVVQP